MIDMNYRDLQNILSNNISAKEESNLLISVSKEEENAPIKCTEPPQKESESNKLDFIQMIQ
jgi:hypothetical protein